MPSTAPSTVYVGAWIRFEEDFNFAEHPKYEGAHQRKLLIWYPDENGVMFDGRLIVSLEGIGVHH